MSRQYIARNPARPFSDAVLIDGKTLYLSGRLGLKVGVDEIPTPSTRRSIACSATSERSSNTPA